MTTRGIFVEDKNGVGFAGDYWTPDDLFDFAKSLANLAGQAKTADCWIESNIGNFCLDKADKLERWIEIKAAAFAGASEETKVKEEMEEVYRRVAEEEAAAEEIQQHWVDFLKS